MVIFKKTQQLLEIYLNHSHSLRENNTNQVSALGIKKTLV